MTDAERLDRLYTAARDLIVQPHDMEARRRFLGLTFNLDRLAVLIVQMGDDCAELQLRRNARFGRSGAHD